ncbi:MAG: hypothetical protein PHY94_03915 [Candidatus Omnitrophica bacterium]|nr:hypothetical protein [Candidatus Omnitrophota bacterium]
MLRKMKKAQAVLEYVLILTALVGAFVVVKDLVKNKVQDGFTNVTNKAADVMSRVDF